HEEAVGEEAGEELPVLESARIPEHLARRTAHLGLQRLEKLNQPGRRFGEFHGRIILTPCRRGKSCSRSRGARWPSPIRRRSSFRSAGPRSSISSATTSPSPR